MAKTEWYVITGGPCAGKTKVIKRLEFLGYSVVHEQARVLIDTEIERGRSTEEIRGNEVEFQKRVLQMKVDLENRIPTDKLIFLDRGIPDSIAYYKVFDQDPGPVIKVSREREYKGIFLLDRLPFEKDYARLEDEKLACTLHQLIHDSYQGLGYNVVKVPIKPIDERVEFILNKTQKP